MNRNIINELVSHEKTIMMFTSFYSEIKPYSEAIWNAFGNNDAAGVISAVDLFTIMLPRRAWINKNNNGLQELLDFTHFESTLEKDIATGKRKLTKLEDL